MNTATDSHSYNLKYKQTKYIHKLLLVKFYQQEWDQTCDLFLMVVKLFHLERYLLSEGGKLSVDPQEDGNAASSSSDGLGRCITALELHLKGHRRKK